MLAGRAEEWKPTAEELGLDSLCGKVMQPLREASSAVDNDDDKLLPQHCLYCRRRNAVIERRNGQGDGSPRKVQDTISKEWK